jgi:tetratricopeptide (TPR) repeat protein
MRAEEGLKIARWIAERVAEGELTREQAEIELAEQFPESCPACCERYDATLLALFAPAPAGVPTTRRYAERLKSVLLSSPASSPESPQPKKRSRALPKQVLVARGLASFETLRAEKSWYRRRERVRLEWHRFRGVEIARRLLEQAHAALPMTPDESRQWADLVLLVLSGNRQPLADASEAVVLRLRSRLLQANAARCRGELDDAAEEMTFVLRTATDLDVRDLAFWCDSYSLLSTLRRNQRDFSAAARAARASAALARGAGQLADQVRASWQSASIHELLGDFSTALSALRQAISAMEGLPDAGLQIGVRHFEVFLLARARRFSEAKESYEALLPLYAQFGDRENFRSWAHALIQAGLERPAEAEAAFRSAREGFLDQKNAYDAALVTLDLSLFLIDQGRAEEVLALAVSMGQAFEALGIARETMAAWAVFQTAAERRELDRAVAEQLVRALGEERGAPRALNS